MQKKTDVLFATPFSKAYWMQAFAEFKDLKVLTFAALMVALRVALKSVSIPISENLNISIGFLINAYASMVYGPVVAILSAAVSDTLGCLLFPKGVYFFPFILTEIAGSLIFALFLYRTRLTTLRVTLSRFCINFFVNIVMNTPIMWLYYRMMLGRNYRLFDAMRIVKNLVLFPLESVLLVLFLRLTIPPTRKLGHTLSDIEDLRFTRRSVIALAALTAVGIAAVVLYTVYA